MSRASTAFADIGWLIGLWLVVPLAILALGAPVVLLVRLVVALVERL